MDVIIKAHLQRADSSIEVRRVPLSLSDNSKDIFNEVLTKVGNAFPGLANKHITLKWKDPDGDLVLMSCDEEFKDAVSNAENSTVKIFIYINGAKESVTGESMDMQSDNAEETARDEDGANISEKEESCEPEWPFMSFMRMPRHPPPAPFCGFRGGWPFGGKCGSRKRGHPDHNNEYGHPGHYFGHFGPHGHQFGRHFGPHHSHHMGMHGPFGASGFFMGHSSHPFHGPSMHFDHHFKHHFGHHYFGKKHEKGHGWKANLRDAVPVPHRRWAKSYIRNWRSEHLKNATSTSSDSDQDYCSTESASVPAAYADWLESLLPIWHRRLGQEGADVCKEKEKSEDKDKLKSSVPLEFRKWTKWYLARHFGQKETPRFRKHCDPPHCDRKQRKHMKKDWKKACKMQTIGVSIPVMHRMWAKIFIQDWRQENNVPDPKGEACGKVSSESEDNEREASHGNIIVPNDYVRWMRKFLAKWHLWRGDIDKGKVEFEKGGMCEFKDTVPKNFRKWVKCFLWRRYGSGTGKEADTASQYQKWMQAFQQKWLQEQEKGGSADELVLTSSDDEAGRGVDSDEPEQTVESCLKKLRLEGNEDGSKKTVSFSAETEKSSGEKLPRAEGVNDDFEETSFHKKLNPGFRQWAKEALWQWDGKSSPTKEQPEGANSDQMPPHVYSWMSKMMMKMQMKKMKQELKEAKQVMKAAKKAQKYKHF